MYRVLRRIRFALTFKTCRNINQIKICMETGRTVILLNLENLYESLYDALNQVKLRNHFHTYLNTVPPLPSYSTTPNLETADILILDCKRTESSAEFMITSS